MREIVLRGLSNGEYDESTAQAKLNALGPAPAEVDKHRYALLGRTTSENLGIRLIPAAAKKTRRKPKQLKLAA